MALMETNSEVKKSLNLGFWKADHLYHKSYLSHVGRKCNIISQQTDFTFCVRAITNYILT